MQKDTNQIFKK